MKKKVLHINKVLCILLLSAVLMNTVIAQQTNTNMNTEKKSGYAPVNGLKMYYEMYGEGKPLVLLHGSYMAIDLNYGQMIPELAKQHKVIALEFQGHGRTGD